MSGGSEDYQMSEIHELLAVTAYTRYSPNMKSFCWDHLCCVDKYYPKTLKVEQLEFPVPDAV